MANYFYSKFLMTCLVSEISKGKKTTNTLVVRHLGYLRKSVTSQHGKILFSKKQLTNILIVKIYMNFYAYHSRENCECSKKISLRFN